MYTKGDRKQSLAMGEAALRIDNRHADLSISNNSFGRSSAPRYEKFLEIPRIQAALQEAQTNPPQSQVVPK